MPAPSPPARMSQTYARAAAALLLAAPLALPLLGQGPDYTANDRVVPYEGSFRPGMNLNYVPPWSTADLADLAAGNEARGIVGLGAKSTRPGLFDEVLGVYGYDASLDDFAYFEAAGMTDLTAIVGFPKDGNRAYFESPCHEEEKWNALFRGIYEPIWDGGANGTPYHDDNLWAAYLYEVVTRYTDQVKFWEIWNEPGLYRGDPAESEKFWGGPDYPGSWWVDDPDPCDYVIHAPIEHFVRTLRVAYEVIKAVSPDDYVAIAGVGSQSFLDALLRNTDEPTEGRVTPEFPRYGGAYFDVLGFHTYPHLDGSTAFKPQNYYARHSDGAADGIIARRLGGYRAVLEKHGYDGVTYPRKEHICTEVNVPRITFTERYFSGPEQQVNFMAKAMIALKLNRVHQMHVFSISDKVPAAEADFEFDAMGMYEYLPDAAAGEAVAHEAAKAYKTASDRLFGNAYDADRTAAMNLPDGLRGYAFAKPAGAGYVYALWAETRVDQSEEASGTYAFDASLLGDDAALTRYDYDAAHTGETAAVAAGEPIALTGRPLFFETGAGSLPDDGGGDGAATGVAGVDLALAIRADRAAVPRYDYVSFALELTNAGTDDATDVAVAFPKPADYAYAGSTSSGGRYSDWIGRWDVGDVPAGATATLEVRLFTLSDEPRVAYAEVSAAGGEPDVDSTPGNGDGAAPAEDDEAAVGINGAVVAGDDDGDGDPAAPPAGVDLELAASASASGYERYATVDYRLELTNAGDRDAVDVAVGVPYPEAFVHTANATAAGRFSTGSQTWRVGPVAAGATVTLDLTLFSLRAEGDATLFAQVAAQAGGPDADSAPANATCCTPREDDEAAVTLQPATTAALRVGEVETAFLPGRAYVTWTAPSRDVAAEAFVSDALGRPLRRHELAAGSGEHREEIRTNDLAPGAYALVVVIDGRATAASFVVSR